MQERSDVLSSYNPNRLFDALLRWLDLPSDKKLSRVLQISLTLIQKMRAGSLPVRALILYRMAECTEKTIEELRVVLGDRRCKVRVF